jgi:hypothetical protein
MQPEPGEIVEGDAVDKRVGTAGGCLQRLPAGAAGGRDLLGARGFKTLPLAVAIGAVGLALPGLVDLPPGEMTPNARI